jgi:murein L,D-transpeptidase YcbB/YkuD
VPATPSEPVEQVLSDTVKQNYYNLARSGKGEDAQRFGALTAELTPGERADYEAFRHAKDAEMIAAKTAEVEARQAEAAARPVQPVMPEVQPGADSEAPMLLLHSLKLRDPNAFKQAFATLSGAEKGRFDAFEAREDARIKANVPAAAPMIPKLSADGERFVTPPAPQATPQNTEAAAQRYGAAEDFHPVAPRAPGEARDIFDAARRPTPHPKTGAAKVLQTIKGLPRRLARRSLIHRSR